jgi:DNA-binding XRE family transcriptional regulator
MPTTLPSAPSRYDALLPLRSRLFALAPLAHQPSAVESLTSYLMRLAEAHCVPVGLLISQAIAPLLPKPYVAGGQGRQISRFLDFAASLNGLGVVAVDWVQVITTLTQRFDLSQVTMLPWADVLSERGLLRPMRQWCPRCYEEGRQAGQKVYEPLLWTMTAVSVCSRHRLRLVCQCPHCQQVAPWLSWHARVGHCTLCGEWLGCFSSADEAPVEASAIQSAELVGALLAAATGAFQVNKAAFTATLTALIQRETQGNQAAFARLVDLPKTTLWELTTGRFLPQLPVLLRLCVQFEVSLPALLAGTEEVRSPNICRSLPERSNRPIARQIVNVGQMRQSLEQVLADSSSPPPSLRSVAHRFGYPPRTLTTHVPELCQAISRRYQTYRKVQGAQKMEALCQKVRATAYDLYARGHLPTYRAVGMALGATGYFREQQARTALHEVWRELGWE